ncbi:hypothetical protein EDD85DRAFT_166681 [Armillaria nabsnona]|nr:hypothetical protein EDD85DRAFT_166681 [Armillaria nabsnona]
MAPCKPIIVNDKRIRTCTYPPSVYGILACSSLPCGKRLLVRLREHCFHSRGRSGGASQFIVHDPYCRRYGGLYSRASFFASGSLFAGEFGLIPFSSTSGGVGGIPVLVLSMRELGVLLLFNVKVIEKLMGHVVHGPVPYFENVFMRTFLKGIGWMLNDDRSTPEDLVPDID